MTTTITEAVERNRPQTALEIVHGLGPQIQRALPKGMDGDRIARLALTAIRKTPRLGECTAESFAGALLTASAMGLEPDVNGEAYLVPYGRECQLIVGYQGYTKLFWQHPSARGLDAQTVYEGDDFDYAKGLDPFLRHRPSEAKDRLERPVTHYWAAVTLSTGGRHFEVLTPEQVKELRGGKVGPDSRFKGGDPMRWMERKTVIRQTLKPMPKSVNLAMAVQSDEREGSDLYMERVAENQPAREQITAGGDPSIIRARILNLYSQIGLSSDENQIEDMSAFAGRSISEVADLTPAERTQLVERLEGVADQAKAGQS